jgi:hypothetical protein
MNHTNGVNNIKQPVAFPSPAMAAIMMTDEETPPKPTLADNTLMAFKHTALLTVIWIIVLTGKQIQAGVYHNWYNKTTCFAGFAVLFVIIDIMLLTYWPNMSQNFVQAGMYYISNMLFACLAENK